MARRRRRRVKAAAGAGLVLIGVLAWMQLFRAEAAPVLVPIYEIETESNGHKGSLANLDMGQPGVPQVPRPVDVDGDLLPDVLVAVNLVDISAAVNNPPDLPAVLAPNIEITRDPAAVARCLPNTPLDKCSPPLKIQVKLTVKDLSNLRSDKVLRFGYDTGVNGSPPGCVDGEAPCPDDRGRIGSIPPYFKAVLRGVEDFFNPVTADVSTRGFAVLGQSLNKVDVARVISGYEGPLDLVGSLGDAEGITSTEGGLLQKLAGGLNQDDDVVSDLRFGYRPWPGEVTVSYGSDDDGHHVKYSHERKDEVDLNTRVVSFEREGDLVDSQVFDARVDRLPRRIELDFDTAERAGKVRYRSKSDGRLPDVRIASLSESLRAMTKTEAQSSASVMAKLEARRAGSKASLAAGLFLGLGEEEVDLELVPEEEPLLAEADIEALPPAIGADWAFPQGGASSALFCAGTITNGSCQPAGQGIGAIEANVRNFYGEAQRLGPLVAEQQQFLGFQTALGGALGPESRIGGRVDRIRELSFAEGAGGFTSTVKVGDGELPLELLFSSDDRTGTKGNLLKAGATVAPLPDAITVSLEEPGDDQKQDPLQLTYTSSKSVDVNSRVEVFKAGAPLTCGRKGTLCGDLGVRHIPASIAVRIGSFSSAPNPAPVPHTFAESRVEIDAVPRPGGARPDFFADITLGDDDDVPLVAHAELLGFPEFVRMRAHEGADQTLDRAEFHACDYDFDASPAGCRAGTDGPEDEIGVVGFWIRNWMQRPDNLPPPSPATPLYATVVARGTEDPNMALFEATGRVSDIRELDYRSANGVTGVRTRLGGGKALSAHADFANVPSDPDDPNPNRLDVLADVVVPSVPEQLDVCFREPGRPVAPASNTFTAPCENPNPFDEDPSPQFAPLSFAYRSSAVFDVHASGRVVDRGKGAANTTVSDDHVVSAVANVFNLPRRLNVDVDSPSNEDGPIRAVFNAPKEAGDPQVSIDADLQQTDADLVCKDPRAPAVGQQAMCVKAGLRNLPETANVSYDPTKTADNLEVHTTGEHKMDVVGFANDPKGAELSSVKRHMPTFSSGKFNHIKGVPALGGKADVLIATGTITGLPRDVTGTLDLPATVDVRASPPLDKVNLSVRNFVGPDPLPQTTPGTRSGVPAANQNVTFLQRGEHFRANIDVGGLTGAAYATQTDSDGKLLETKILRVNFAPGNTVRAYADLASLGDEADPSSLQQTIADVTLPNVPRGLNVCFRGQKEATTTTSPVSPVFCDLAPQPNEGAFSFTTDPSVSNANLDVHAFLRFAKAGATDVLAARTDLLNVPKVVQGTYAQDGKITFAGFGNANASGFGQNPDGIDQVRFDVANFDIPTSGYPVNGEPWEIPKRGTITDFPGDPGGQNLRLRVDPNSLRAAGTVGQPGATGNLQSVLFDNVACPPPPDPPGDYATYFPTSPATGTTLTCIRAMFDPGGSPSPLKADVAVDKNGKRLAFHSGGLDRIPDFIQLTLANAPVSDAAGRFLTPCGPATPSPSNPTCMPPLIRFDSKSNANLAGVFEFGTRGDLQQVDKAVPAGPIANLAAPPPLVIPGANPWSDWGGDPHGLRGRVSTFKGPGDETRVAVKAGLRLEVPKSLTIDQVQSWTGPSTDDEAKDIKFHYVVRNASGVVSSPLGQAAAMLNLEGKQILLTGDNPAFGLDIPGEVGLGVFLRHHKRPDGASGSDTIDRMFAQIDGRTSAPITARARIFGLSNNAAINALVRNVPGYEAGDNTANPSFRLRFEMADEKKKGPQLCPLVCVVTEVGLETINATFDFGAARRVDAFVNMDAPKVGLDAQGFRSIDPADGTRAEISANAGVSLDPFNLFIHAGIPVLGSFDMVLLSELKATANIDRAERFQLTDNLLHLRAKHEGSGSGSSVNVEFRPRIMAGALTSIFGVFIGNPIIYGFTFLPPAVEPTPPALITFFPCPGGGGAGINTVPVGANDTMSAFGWLQNPPLGPELRFITFGALGSFDILGKLVSPVFCLFSADFVGQAGHPGPPFATPDHDVPGSPPTPPPAPPPPPPPPPELNVTSGTTDVCGDKIYKSVTVSAGATLRVANVAGPNCAAPDVGKLSLAAQETITIAGALQAATGSTGEVTATAKNISVPAGGLVQATLGPVNLMATEKVQVDGHVLANGVSAATVGGTGPTGNGGAGHGGAGGKGGNGGNGGTAYGDESFAPVDGLTPTEAGSVGAGPGTPGRGGGRIRIGASTVRIAGQVRADGSAGSNNVSGAANCTNASTAGAGGGSGGGLVLSGARVDLTGGTVSASGGRGGNGERGGGGGGGGGIVKVISPLLTGNAVADRGDHGTTACPSEAPENDDQHGAAGKVLRLDDPASQVLALDQFWNKGGGLQVPYHAAAPSKPGNPNFTVILCGARRPPEASENSSDPNFGIDMPTANNLLSPCGSNTGDTTVSELGRTTVAGQESAAGAKIPVASTPPEGFWGLYTMAVKAGRLDNGNPNNCFSTGDNGGIFGGLAYDIDDCRVEALPTQPNTTIGVDNSLPTTTITIPTGDKTKTQDIAIAVTAKDEMAKPGGTVAISGVKAVECSNDNVTFTPCTVGQNAWRVSPGSGTKTVHVRAVDQAGHVGVAASASIVLDTTTPTSSGFVKSPVPNDGANGWYRTSPTFRIEDFDDGGEPPPATGRFKWWVDGGTPSFCDTDCDVATNLSDGKHQFHWQAIDAVGNEEPVQTIPVKVDRKNPLSALLPVPEAPDGANGWYVRNPWIVISAVDTPGGSGLVNTAAEAQNAGIFYRVDGTPLGPVKPRNFVPFQLGPGSHEVCWRVVDVSGRSDPATGEHCRQFKVDLERPTVAIAASGAVGGDGWYVSPVTVDVSGADTAPGSGINAAVPPSGVFVSVDGGAFVANSGPITIPEGLHEVRAFSVDVAGQRSPIKAAAFKVDLSQPVTAARVIPPAPARAEWWRRLPRVVLRATDGERNAGVERIQYFLDGSGPFDYKGPFEIPAGVHTVTYGALDRSGRIEPSRDLVVPVDVSPPVAKATSPDPVLWTLPPVGPAQAKLKWTVKDDLSDQIRAVVIVYNSLGQPVRRIVEATPRTITPGAGPQEFVTLWDGKDDSVLGLVKAGGYYYRVVVMDEAGHFAQSGESRPLQVKVGGGGLL